MLDPAGPATSNQPQHTGLRPLTAAASTAGGGPPAKAPKHERERTQKGSSRPAIQEGTDITPTTRRRHLRRPHRGKTIKVARDR